MRGGPVSLSRALESWSGCITLPEAIDMLNKAFGHGDAFRVEKFTFQCITASGSRMIMTHDRKKARKPEPSTTGEEDGL